MQDQKVSGRPTLPTILLLGVVLLLVVLLLRQEPWRPSILALYLDRHGCEFDRERQEVIVDVPIRVRTRGQIGLLVRAELLDRHNPDRQPYVSSRIEKFDTDGKTEERSLTFRIPLRPSQWAAGQDQCVVTLSPEDG